jgi:6-phosphofructokinase 1
MRYGVQGLLAEQVVDLSGLGDEALRRLACTPSAALGSCRYKLQAGDAERIADYCRATESRR